MPLLVYFVGAAFGTETLRWGTAANMAVVVAGVVAASYAELKFVLAGVVLQLASNVTEAVRLTLVQILLQRRGIKLNPVTTMYHLAPVCLGFLALPFAFIEASRLMSGTVTVRYGLLLLSAAAAFGALFVLFCFVLLLLVCF